MKSARADRLKEIISRLRIAAAWTLLAGFYCGMEMGRHIWQLHDDFYPFTILLWGAMTIYMVFMVRGLLVGLPLAVPLADADSIRMRTRGFLLSDIIVGCISISLGLCLGPAKHVGGMYRVGAAVLGAALLLISVLMHRAIKRLAVFATSLVGRDESIL
jgi:hypothetical protein